MERNGYVVVANAEKSLATAETGDLTDFIFGQIQYILNEPCLLFLHLHNQLNTAGVHDTFAVLAAIQTE